MSSSAPRTKNPVPDWIQVPYPHVGECIISFPRKHILLVTINRPQFMNCLPVETTIELGTLWKWYDSEPELRAAVFTGAGERAFCAGMDLKQRLDILNTNDVAHEYPHGGFGGMTNRTGKKPIIIACNGHAHGGGMEIVLNADVIFASPNADFRLPEVLRGVSALAGALPRCMVLFGNHRTMDLVLTGRTLTLKEAVEWGLVKEVVPQDKLLERAIDYADEIAALCPDSVIISRLAAREAWETGISRATMRGQELWAENMLKSKNAAEGLAAYREKRKPKWYPSHL
ncbi:carnitinyl-CoA dehydratase [Xylaria bambusicola]|uniref:carnitinyl-CoA dehydratase n=1 Tax=Xylaria bambusicola TaxID=326684 RepID=UPI0020078034|nr:carnitinyl-CoA dehydratase [Xylaria bambusicola]KAI0508829.1 carnitinyl-CoA dehydratase [Xylaria bambusicola]